MKIKKRKINELISAEYNPRKISVVQLYELKEGIAEFGLVEPLVVNENPERKNVIVGGHQRLKIWKELGNTEVDCSIVNLPLDKERKLNIKLNKNGGTFDDDLLKEFFDYEELIEWGFTASDLFNFNFDKIDKLEEGEEIEIPQSVQLEPPKEYILIMCDPNSEDWEQLKIDLQLRIVRKGGYKKGSAFDAVSMERVLTYKDFKKRYENSNTKQK